LANVNNERLAFLVSGVIKSDTLQVVVLDLLSVGPVPEEGVVTRRFRQDPLAGVVGEGTVSG